MSEEDLATVYKECVALRDRLQAELRDWAELCRRHIEMGQAMKANVTALRGLMREMEETLDALRQRIREETDGDDWWMRGERAPWDPEE